MDLYIKLKEEGILPGKEVRVKKARGLLILKNAFIKAMDSYFNGNRAKFHNQERAKKSAPKETAKISEPNKKVNALIRKFQENVEEKLANGLTENDLKEFKNNVIAQKVKLNKAREYFNAISESDLVGKEKGGNNLSLAENTHDEFKKIYKRAKLEFSQQANGEGESILEAERRIKELQEELAAQKRRLDELKGGKTLQNVNHRAKLRKLSENEIKMFAKAKLKSSNGELIALDREYTLEQIEIIKICVLKILRGFDIIEGEQNKQYQRELATHLSTLMKENEHTPKDLAFRLSSKQVTVEDALKNANII